MWLEEGVFNNSSESDADTDSSGEELSIWVRGEQRWVSGIVEETTCRDVVNVLLQNEESKGQTIGQMEDYHITERWRGVEQPLDPDANILHIWNAWGTAQLEVKFLLRRIKSSKSYNRRSKYRSDTSLWSDMSAFKTIHPKRLKSMQEDRQPSSAELLKLVLAQGEVIRKQLKKLRNSDNQIGHLEDKTHRARVRKHGSNYLLETYLRGLSEATVPTDQPVDKNSDSGVVTEGDSEQSNKSNKNYGLDDAFLERFSSPSIHSCKEEDSDSEGTVHQRLKLFKQISEFNKLLLQEEKALNKLHTQLEEQNATKTLEKLNVTINQLRTDTTKSLQELHQNERLLQESKDSMDIKRTQLEHLHRDLCEEDQEFQMLQALLYTQSVNCTMEWNTRSSRTNFATKEMFDTLV